MDELIGVVKLFAGNFAPVGWHFCDGSLLPIQQYAALYSLIGNYYGGDGRTNFALPDLRGRVPVGAGLGPGLTQHNIGEKFGSETNTLQPSNLPNTFVPQNVTTGTGVVSGASGQNHIVPVNNMQPSLSMNYIICYEGLYPSRP